jgi:hypothetical protein
MERKALAALGLLVLVALAGCSATGSLSTKTADDVEMAEAASRPAVVDSPAPDDREVVREAIDGVYYAEDTDNESFRSIMDQFSAESATEADSRDGTWLVRYDAKAYVAELSYRGFDQNDRPVRA